MRVGIDVGPALGGPSGLRRYLQSYLAALAALRTGDEFHLCGFFWKGFPERAAAAALPSAPNFKLQLRRVPQRLVLPLEHYAGLRLQQRLLEPLGLDVFHGTAAVLPRLRGLPSALTVHHIDDARYPSPWDDFYFRRLPRRALAQADVVMSISESTRRTLTGAYGVPEAKVRTVYYGGASPEFRPEPDGRGVARFGVAGPYFLFVSALTARKNLGLLLRAFARLERERPGRLTLVCAAYQDPAYVPAFRALVAELGLEGRVTLLEGLSADDLRSLYQGCRAMVYPSTLEGFGLPLLEAMACGAPVLAANATCLPEIGGGAALYAEPQDDAGLAALMRRVDEDEALRAELRAKGLARAREFSWERNARETLDAYRDAARTR